MWQGSKRRLVGEISNQGQAGYMCVWTSRATYSQSSYHILQRYDSSAKRPLPCCRSSGSLPFLSRNIHVPIDRLLPQPVQDHTRRPRPFVSISTPRPALSPTRQAPHNPHAPPFPHRRFLSMIPQLLLQHPKLRMVTRIAHPMTPHRPPLLNHKFAAHLPEIAARERFAA